MKKIMYNDKYCLTQAVLEGRKPVTRRLVGNRMAEDDIRAYLKGYTELANKCAYYKIGEAVAVAQPYKDIANTHHFIETCLANEWRIDYRDAGWNNKMFVKPCLMPHQIRITGIKVELLQDISDEDCLREGIQAFDTPDGKVFVAGGVYVGQDTRLKIAKGMINLAKPFKTPQEAFASLIDKVSGNGTWESNPWVFVYEHEQQ